MVLESVLVAASSIVQPYIPACLCGAPLCAFALLLVWPLVKSLHYVMLLWDTLHRWRSRRHQRAWKFQTIPHVRQPLAAPAPSTIKHWHLVTEQGRQRWVYDASRKAPAHTFVEQYHLGICEEAKQTVPQERPTVRAALDDGVQFLLKLQHPTSGHWPNDYSGPMFLLPGAVIVKFITNDGDLSKMFAYPAQRTEFLRYLYNYQNTDGGWGMHTEGQSTMFGTVLNYVTVRLLGEPEDSDCATNAREWIRSRGGAQSIPSWGKVWLCVLGVYEYAGLDVIPPELTLVPDWFPISLGNIWCHSRIVSTPFSWFYGKKWQAKPHPVTEALKQEMYVTPYEKINWAKQSSNVYQDDIYTPHSYFYELARVFLGLYEKVHSRSLRERALARAWEHIQYDDSSTDFICLGPVNKALDMLITWIECGPDSYRFTRHVERLEDYFYICHDGMRMSGYNGSQLWDTSFAIQAIVAAQQQRQYPEAMGLGHQYIDVAQVREDPPEAERFYRCRTKGAWNFSTRAQSWQVSDCTAEGLRVVLLLRGDQTVLQHTNMPPFDESRIFDAVDEILELRNKRSAWRDTDHGWASYEPPRAPRYMELLNCAEVYKDVMIDYTYAECSSSCVHSLCLFQKQFPQYRQEEVRVAIAAGLKCIMAKQRPDGSFYGSWGVCFTYAAWLVADALEMAGIPKSHPVLQKLAAFLLTKQHADGGWGEDFNACVTQEWVENADGSQVVNTSWAVMALLASGAAEHHVAIRKGVYFIMSRQLPSGDWPQERISGVFNGNAAIHYPGYKNCMPVWALAKYQNYLRSSN